MTKKNLLVLISLLICVYCLSGETKTSQCPDFPNIALTNNVSFLDSTFNNTLAGCAFLVKTPKNILAVTCKHSLWVAKTDKMKAISFEGQLKEWRMQVKNDSTSFLICGNLINEDSSELIGEENVNSDYLIFFIKENHSQVKPLTVRNTDLIKGEPVYFIGWSFLDKTGPQKIYTGTFVKKTANHLLIDMPYQNMAGMSGGAVIDKKGELIGIVSNYYYDETEQKWYISPCDTTYLKKIIKDKKL